MLLAKPTGCEPLLPLPRFCLINRIALRRASVAVQRERGQRLSVAHSASAPFPRLSAFGRRADGQHLRENQQDDAIRPHHPAQAGEGASGLTKPIESSPPRQIRREAGLTRQMRSATQGLAARQSLLGASPWGRANDPAKPKRSAPSPTPTPRGVRRRGQLCREPQLMPAPSAEMGASRGRGQKSREHQLRSASPTYPIRREPGGAAPSSIRNPRLSRAAPQQSRLGGRGSARKKPKPSESARFLNNPGASRAADGHSKGETQRAIAIRRHHLAAQSARRAGPFKARNPLSGRPARNHPPKGGRRRRPIM